MKNELIMDKIHSAVARSRNILLLTHDNPDVDAISSVYAFTQYLNHMNRPHAIFFTQILPEHLARLDPLKAYVTDQETAFTADRDLIIAFDSGDLIHTGVAEGLSHMKERAIICNIDHHPTNTFFGHLNLVMPAAVSTTEILYHWYLHQRLPPSRQTAALMLAGILADTNTFTNYNTSKAAVEIAGQLMRRGIHVSKVFKHIQQKKSAATLAAWGKVLSRLKKNEASDIAYTVITKDDLAAVDDPDIFQGLTNYLNAIADAKISMIIKEMPENILRVSLRSNDDLIDVSKFAKIFNGGGHKKAAGFSLPGRLEKTDTGWKIV